jgi:uncharacterized protein YabN with tetrapyrrole methylase and pyrophosphatase domain
MRKKRRIKTGSLTVVGTGYLVGAQITAEARASIESAQKLFYAVSDLLTEKWLQSLNPTAESLRSSYAVGKKRSLTYEEMVERMLVPVRAGLHVCTAFYGHPGVCSYPPREAVQRARSEGFTAVMLPGISAEDCLFADLNIDPSHGCQSMEATRFVMRNREPDPSLALVLWQIGLVGERSFKESDLWSRKGLARLAGKLRVTYPAKHRVTIYETSFTPLKKPHIQTIPLGKLPRAAVTVASLLYVPPLHSAARDKTMEARLAR